MDKNEARRAYLRCMQVNPLFFITRCAKEREMYLRSQAQWQREHKLCVEWFDVLSVIL